jgi:hypothetical protein
MNSCRGLLITACGLFLLCGLRSFAQETPSAKAATSITRMRAVRDTGWEKIPPVVTGMPYSAVTEAETLQTLSDGTHIDHKMERTKTYRDSQGRTRMERYLPTGLSNNDPPTLGSVMIRDPVAGVSYFLNVQKHTVRQTVFHMPAAENNGVVTRLETRTSPAGDRPSIKVTVEDLGTQVIDGLAVSGKKVTSTIPASAQGNDRPFDVVAERWFSSELKVYVLIKTADQRSGEHNIKTTVTDRSEPDISLFQIPPDYTITQQ